MLSFFHPGEFIGEEETLDFLSSHRYGTGLQIVFQRCQGFSHVQYSMDKRPKKNNLRGEEHTFCTHQYYMGPRNACVIQTSIEVLPFFY